ncbi:MAG: bifunctional phosphopantothenoylcysteine decarboxylase/phosphopantothenate--cysteine ligase CoaBC [Desulfatiglans sp.]|jgi:phosphopantothenoylcysteine decarboxylase/phosphopantothenate--cysteine ligase|nr:bifunctional phosphopantothenoylcysteine decarboxylase/phosphopantothenate--cysteine ligase CoaBC [Thermodesulfobacteriota bacterium]MEE4351637.1 bifunctional phosphopantothenoylcysteine decarboxylase/phosphopantothenate--cysteine ligase CoaBC [Desulfatiglans sp.]
MKSLVLKGKTIIVGITGGIASYKAAELVRLLVKSDTITSVAMTRNATQFISPMTFEALSGNRVIYDMFTQDKGGMEHIVWGQEADLIIIAPATANFIAKMAHGIGDDFLSTMILAATARVLVCPSMNSRMFLNPALQDNLGVLRKRGFSIMSPGEGELACKTEGPGRLPEPEDILEHARTLLSPHDLSGKRILVTAGATTEQIDPVRYISNRSSGKMGYALAVAAKRRGAEITLISGPTALAPPQDIKVIHVKSAVEMKDAVFENCRDCDVIVKAAAVSDYRSADISRQKIKKGKNSLTVELVKNPDILAELGAKKKDSTYLLVGFAAETEDLITNAKEKLRAKNLDMIVANDVSRNDAGFETETNIVKIIYEDGRIEDSPLMAKSDIADLVLDKVKGLLERRQWK